jgi:hypothetical protein
MLGAGFVMIVFSSKGNAGGIVFIDGGRGELAWRLLDKIP